jgi:hypothetical protein
MWVGLGNLAIWIRMLCALGWCVWMTLLGTREPLRWELEFLASAGLMLLLAAAPYGLLKVLGFRIEWRDPSVCVDPRFDRMSANATHAADLHGNRLKGMQFSIVQIFAWTALAGVMAVLARIAGMGPEALLPLFIMVCITAALGLTTLWAVLFGERVGARILAPFGLVLAVTVIFVALARGVRGEEVAMTFSALTLAIAAVASVLGLFRSVGYRVRRQSRLMIRPAAESPVAAQPTATNPWDAEV